MSITDTKQPQVYQTILECEPGVYITYIDKWDLITFYDSINSHRLRLPDVLITELNTWNMRQKSEASNVNRIEIPWDSLESSRC